MAAQATPPLTGKQVDFTTTLFGHDYAFSCKFREGHPDPEVHRIVGWVTPQLEVGDVMIGKVHREDGSRYVGKLVVLEIEHHDNPPDYFSAIVQNFDDGDSG